MPISIIMPCHNVERFLSSAIESVRNQTHENWELLAIDDGSSDATPAILARYQELEPRMKVFRYEHSQGPAEARNKGLQEAKHNMIAFLDSDDWWAPQKLEKQLGFMEDYSIAFSFTAYQKVTEDALHQKSVVEVPREVTYYDLLKTCSIGCSTVMIDKSSYGEFRFPEIQKRQDFALWLQLLKTGLSAYGLNEALSFYRLRTESVSSSKRKSAAYQWKVYREIENLDLLSSAYYFSNYAVRGSIKYLR